MWYIQYRDGFLVTRETLSQEAPSPAAEAYERATGENKLSTDGFFVDENDADNFIEGLYDAREAEGRPFEYGPMWSDDPYSFAVTHD